MRNKESEYYQWGTYFGDLDEVKGQSTLLGAEKVLSKLNGFYALLWERSGSVFASANHVRSIPLFYASREEKFFVSDDADWVRTQINNKCYMVT